MENTPEVKLNLGERNKQIKEILQSSELKMQEICLNVPDISLVVSIANYKSEYKKYQEKRREFTGYVEGLLITPLIAKESSLRPEIFEPCKALVKRELDIRLEQEKKVLKANEKISYELHVNKEFQRVYNEIKLDCFKNISHGINELQCLPTDETLLSLLKEKIFAKKVYNKFENKFLNDEEKLEIAKGLQKPNWEKLYDEMLLSAQDAYNGLISDGGGVIEELVNNAIQEHTDNIKQDEVSAAIAQSSTTAFFQNNNKPVNRKKKIVLTGTREWARLIIKNFVDLPEAWLMLDSKIKSFEKLTVKQMAEALEKSTNEIEGLEYEEFTK